MKPLLINHVIGLAILSLVGCATTPLFPGTVMRDVDSKVEFGALTATPDVYKGRVIQLAGRIVGVEQRAEGTVIAVHRLPIATHPIYGPVERNGRNGDFTVLFPGKLQPADAVAGNRIMVIGTTKGPQDIEIAGVAKSTPHLLARCVAIWETAGEEISDYIVRHGGDFYPQIEQTYCTKVALEAS